MSAQWSDQNSEHGEGRAQRTFRRMRADAPLEFCVEACLAAQSRYSACRQCEAACPAAALQLADGGIALSAACVGCGRCAVACPTDALGVPGFALPDVRPDRPAPVFIDCWKVPVADSPTDAIRVPCLGGISLGRMVALRVAAGARPVVLLDRGWCASCAAGTGAAHPAAGCIDAARELLQAIGMPPDRWPALASQPLPAPAHPLRAAVPARADAQPLSRRAFFGDLAARITNTASEINPATAGKQPPIARGHERRPARSRERDRLLAQVKRLATSTGRPVPQSLYPAVQINPCRCSHDRLCAATCPTGALVAFNANGVSGIVFDSSGCVTCGHCEAICPSQALRLLPRGDGRVPAAPEVLVRVRQRECAGCGRPFDGAAGDTECPACAKRSRLAGAAFQALFGKPT